MKEKNVPGQSAELRSVIRHLVPLDTGAIMLRRIIMKMMKVTEDLGRASSTEAKTMLLTDMSPEFTVPFVTIVTN